MFILLLLCKFKSVILSQLFKKFTEHDKICFFLRFPSCYHCCSNCHQCCIGLNKNKEKHYEPIECSGDSVYQNDEAMKDQHNTSLPIRGFPQLKLLLVLNHFLTVKESLKR